MLDQILAATWPSLSRILDRSKPYSLQAFQYFGPRIYAVFLVVLVIIQADTFQTLDCDSNDDELDDLADDICMIEQGYVVDYRLFQVDLANRWSRKPHYGNVNGRPYEVMPGIAPLQRNFSGQPYSYVTTILWIDFAFLAQIFLFLIPSFLWAALRDLKFITYFEKVNWNLSKILCFHTRKSRVQQNDNEFEMITIKGDSHKSEPIIKPVSLPEDQCIRTLLRIAYSRLAVNIFVVILSQVAVILLMTLAWDCMFTLGGNENYRFTKFGFQLMQYWHAWHTWDSKKPFPYEYPGDKLFPSMIKCNYERIGPSGETTRTDVICALVGNYIMEKFIIITWFYFAAFLLIDLGVILYDFVWLAIRPFRRVYIRSILNANTTAAILKNYQKYYYNRIPDDFECPFSVAIFVPYLIRNIGPMRASTILKHFIYKYNKQIGKQSFTDEQEQIIFSSENCSHESRPENFWDYFQMYRNIIEEYQTVMAVHTGEIDVSESDNRNEERLENFIANDRKMNTTTEVLRHRKTGHSSVESLHSASELMDESLETRKNV